MHNILLILIITIAGPLLGSLLGIIKRPSDRFTYNMLAFAAGVMISIAFFELIPESIELATPLWAIIGLIVGATIMYIADRLIPHDHADVHDHHKHMKKTAIFIFLGIFLHNFPEGMAIAFGSVTAYATGLTIAIALAIHNVPSTMTISAPYFYATGKRLKSFLLAFGTIIPLLVGFGIAYFILGQINNLVMGVVAAITAGLIIFISVDEIIPTSCNKLHKASHGTVFSFILGVVLLILLEQLH